MATAEQTPGRLDLAFRQGDAFSTLIDFSISLVSKTLTAQIRSAVTGEVVATPTIAAVDLATGQINLSLTVQQTQALAAGSYSWLLKWTEGVGVRTALEGYVEVLP
jgi:hypothetical protein